MAASSVARSVIIFKMGRGFWEPKAPTRGRTSIPREMMGRFSRLVRGAASAFAVESSNPLEQPAYGSVTLWIAFLFTRRVAWALASCRVLDRILALRPAVRHAST